MAIDSVIAQTYTHWELIVVNDSSTDRTCEIVRQYEQRDKRISLHDADYHNGMPSAPRNTGVRLAKGRFISFLDSDDIWASTKLAEQVPLFEDDKVVVVYSNYEKMDEEGHRNNRIVRAPRRLNYAILLRGNAIGNLTGIYDTQKVGKVKIKDIQTEEDSHGRADREEAVLQLSLSGRRDGKGSGASVYCNRQQRFLEEPGTQCVV